MFYEVKHDGFDSEIKTLLSVLWISKKIVTYIWFRVSQWIWFCEETLLLRWLTTNIIKLFASTENIHFDMPAQSLQLAEEINRTLRCERAWIVSLICASCLALSIAFFCIFESSIETRKVRAVLRKFIALHEAVIWCARGLWKIKETQRTLNLIWLLQDNWM